MNKLNLIIDAAKNDDMERVIQLATEMQDKFCDANCVWTDHHPDCKLGQPDRYELQAKGEHPAPCARFCEANAFHIEIRSLKKQLEQAQNGWLKALEKLQAQKQEPVGWEPLTDSQIMASVGRNAGKEKTSISESRPLGQQWEQICELVRHIVRERYTSPPQRQPLTDVDADAKKLAECMDCSWEHMPEQVRNTMREHAKKIIDDAYGITGEQK